MGRRLDRQLERQKPEHAFMIRAAHGDLASHNALTDCLEEEGLINMASLMMAQKFEIGQAYWLETAIWVYFGIVSEVGNDYIEITQACRMHVDGRHSTMMETGTAPGIEIETTGGKSRTMVIPIDWIGPNCTWDHPIPKTSVSPART